MKKLFCSCVSFLLFLLPLAYSQNVGIGITTPQALLHVADSNVLFSAAGDIPVTQGNPPATGAGRRTMWYPDKAAFRTGSVSGTFWDKDSIGNYSFAAGYNVKAKGIASIAIGVDAEATEFASISMGYITKATNNNAIALGLSTLATSTASVAIGSGDTATGSYAVAMGYQTKSTGQASTSLGYRTEASGSSSTALGDRTKSTGFYSTSMGYFSTASGNTSLASGGNVTASGNNSTAIGYYASTNAMFGSCVITDASTTTVLNSSVMHQMSMRFSGGYRLYSNNVYTAGVQVSAGGGSWTSISDRRLKENFRKVSNEELLQKIAALPITNWNYKSQPASQRHIGPMAQDFYAAFQLDGEGADTTINTMDIIGVNMAAIQALEKRTQRINNIEKENAQLKDELVELKARLKRLESLLVKE